MKCGSQLDKDVVNERFVRERDRLQQLGQTGTPILKFATKLCLKNTNKRTHSLIAITFGYKQNFKSETNAVLMMVR